MTFAITTGLVVFVAVALFLFLARRVFSFGFKVGDRGGIDCGHTDCRLGGLVARMVWFIARIVGQTTAPYTTSNSAF